MIKYVKLGGKKRPVSLGTWSISLFCEKYGLDLQGFLDMLSSEGLSIKKHLELFKIALEEGAEKKGQEVEAFTEKQIAYWCDEEPGKFQELSNAIVLSLPIKTEEDEEEEEEEEKHEEVEEGNQKG